MTPTRPSANGGKQLAAVATAAIPVVMLSSLAMAVPATAAPTHPGTQPHGSHGALNSADVLAAIHARTAQLQAKASSIPAAVVASSLPTAVTATPLVAQTQVAQALIAKTAANIRYTVKSGDTVSAIAAKHGVSTSNVLSLNKLSNASIIYPGQVLVISGAAKSTAAAPSTSAATAAASYTVKSGDTLSGIASKHKVSLGSIFSLNGLNGSSVIHPGQKIKVGGTAQAATPSAPSTAAPTATTSGKYTIKSGDTLGAIAAKHGVSLSALASANGITVNGVIYPGKVLTIPGLKSSSSSITPLAPKPALTPEQEVPSTFLHYTYPAAVVADANKNKAALLAAPSPTRAQMKQIVSSTASKMGVDPALAMAFAQQESGFNHQSVSPANAIGTMQVIPDAGDWASGLVGRKLNLLDPYDNVTAGVAIIRALLRGAPTEDLAIAGYYQGEYSVHLYGMYPDTVNYVAGIKANRNLFR